MDSVWDRIALIDWDGVRNTLTRVKDNTCSTAGRIEGEHSLDIYVEAWHIEYLEHDLSHLFSI